MGIKAAAKALLTVMCGVLASCAIITVNVYFPEKDVKQAYRSLDDMLLKQGKEEGTSPDVSKPPEEMKNEKQSMLHTRSFNFFIVAPAFADEPVADQLAVEISSRPEVLKAYAEMKERLPQLNSLCDSGAVGENKQGLVSVRDKDKLGDNQPLVDAENANRKTIITAMAKAILKINKQKESSAAMNQVLGKAAASYGATRQEEARPGWWIELPNGRWVQK